MGGAADAGFPARPPAAAAAPNLKRETWMKLVRALAIAALMAASSLPAFAETYPARQIKIIVSTSAGGITDVVARILGQYITAKTGQAVVIDNRAGAGGNIAMDAVAKSAPDGYTLGVANTGNIVINPYLYRSMPYDPLNDLVPVGSLGEVPLFMVVNGKIPPRNLQEFVAYAKANPVSYGSAGIGTTPHLAADAFNRRTGLNMVHVPYRGSTAATMDVLSGVIPMTFVSLGQHIEHVRQGTLRVLGIASARRVAYLPDVATFAEQGFAGLETGTWFALFAPRGTPREIVEQLNGYIRETGDDPDSKRRLEATFTERMNLTASEFADLVKADAAKWERIVRESGVKQD
jgi:tripartite-type tricarboxylate transporter receptor subunit TctC